MTRSMAIRSGARFVCPIERGELFDSGPGAAVAVPGPSRPISLDLTAIGGRMELRGRRAAVWGAAQVYRMPFIGRWIRFRSFFRLSAARKLGPRNLDGPSHRQSLVPAGGQYRGRNRRKLGLGLRGPATPRLCQASPTRAASRAARSAVRAPGAASLTVRRRFDSCRGRHVAWIQISRLESRLVVALAP